MQKNLRILPHIIVQNYQINMALATITIKNFNFSGLSCGEDYSLSKDDVKNINNVMKQIEVKTNKKMPGTDS